MEGRGALSLSVLVEPFEIRERPPALLLGVGHVALLRARRMEVRHAPLDGVLVVGERLLALGHTPQKREYALAGLDRDLRHRARGKGDLTLEDGRVEDVPERVEGHRLAIGEEDVGRGLQPVPDDSGACDPDVDAG